MDIARNLWLMAAWGDDITRELHFTQLVEQPLVLYRTQAGKAVALADTCPHRFAPLHRGRLVEDTVECGYHGLRFDAAGRCVHNPHGGGVPKQEPCVQSYPVHEQNGIVWVWCGQCEKADISKVPDFPWLDDDRYEFTGGMTMEMELSSDLLVDNLLDLSHAAYLHPNTLGAQAGTADKVSIEREGSRIYSNRLIPEAPPAVVFTATGAAQPDEIVDYWANMRWDPPGSFYLDAGIVAAGGRKEDGRILSSVQVVTPAAPNRSYYFWKLFRNFGIGQAAVTAGIEQAVTHAFKQEDEPMIRAVQERMAGREFWSLKPCMLGASDSAANQARRIMQKLYEAELPSPALTHRSDANVTAEVASSAGQDDQGSHV